MSAPIILPRGMDELLSQRQEALRLASLAFDRPISEAAFMAQCNFLVRLDVLIARRAAA